MASRMVDVSVVVWPADRYLEDIVGGNVFCEDMTVLNATHMVALLEARLQKNRGVPIAIGKVEYYDDSIQKWMVLVAEHDLERFAQPIKLRVWGRSRHFNCRVLPLRASSQNFAPRAAAFYASDYAEFEAELRSRLPKWEQDFRDILYNDPVAGWVLLEDISAIPESLKCVDLKLIPSEQSSYRSNVNGVPASRWLGEDADFENLDGMSKLEALVNLENARQQEEQEHALREADRKKRELRPPRERRVVPHKELQYGDKTIDMPLRMGTAPLAHTAAEIRYLHNDAIKVDPNNPYYVNKQNHEKFADPNRDECCYPGSGLVHSMDTSGHGDLKREVIAYIRAILQDPYSPLADYLPRGGLPTNDLVNLTSLAAHYFMVRCPVRPNTLMDQEDRAHVHSILAHCIAEMPFAERRQREREREQQLAAEEGFGEAAIGDQGERRFIPPVPDPNNGNAPPQVVLMRPLLTEDLEVIVYGTVTCKLPVLCKWRLRSNLHELDMEGIFDKGLALTEPVSSSSFCIKLLPGALLRGQTYHLTLVATSDPDQKSDSATQQFSLPA